MTYKFKHEEVGSDHQLVTFFQCPNTSTLLVIEKSVYNYCQSCKISPHRKMIVTKEVNVQYMVSLTQDVGR